MGPVSIATDSVAGESLTRRKSDYLIPVEDDGLIAAKVGDWGAEKYRRLGMYAEIFSTGMKNVWPTRVYLDLCAGPGHALLGNTGRRVLTSPLLALRVPNKFSKYIFCDKMPANINVLRARVASMQPDASVEYVVGDVNDLVDDLASLIPSHSKSSRVLNFCFVDPFGLGNIDFATIKTLGANRAMDFLTLLALGMDANRNRGSYVQPGSSKVERWLGDPDWRTRWIVAKAKGASHIQFLATEYARAMTALGHKTTSPDQMIEVKTYDNNMLLYYLAFFSKHQKGYDLWDQARKYSTDQLGFPL